MEFLRGFFRRGTKPKDQRNMVGAQNRPPAVSAVDYSAGTLRSERDRIINDRDAAKKESEKRRIEEAERREEQLNREALEIMKEWVSKALTKALEEGPRQLKAAASSGSMLETRFLICKTFFTFSGSVYRTGETTIVTHPGSIEPNNTFWRWFFKGGPKSWPNPFPRVSNENLETSVEAVAKSLPQYEQIKKKYGYNVTIKAEHSEIQVEISA